MAGIALPADAVARIATLERRLENLSRAQNPLPGSILDLRDVGGVPTGDGQVLTYNRAAGQWQAVTPASSGVQAGDLVFSAATSAPAGTVLCNGASGLRSDYPALFAAIGTTYGSADGTHFNVPDYRDRFPVGAGGSKALGSTGGANDAINVSHTHAGPSHTHGTNVRATSAEAAGFNLNTTGVGFGDRVRVDGSGDVSAAGGTAATGATGGSATNANLPPYLACFIYIRF